MAGHGTAVHLAVRPDQRMGGLVTGPADPAGVGDSAGWDEAAGSGSGRAAGASMVSWASRWAGHGRSPA